MNKVMKDMPIESWPDEATSSVWGRDRQGKFFARRWQGRDIDSRWSRYDAAIAVGCTLSVNSEDGGTEAAPACFPASFGFSPFTGKPLVENTAKLVGWLPPHGNNGLKTALVRGGKLTCAPLRLQPYTEETNAVPAESLPFPAVGTFRFLVGAFGLQRSSLIALDWKNGVLYCWLPADRAWVKLTAAAGSVFLGSEEIADEFWNVECTNLTQDALLYWPCDAGLGVVRIEPLTLTYSAQLVAAGTCYSQPLALNDKVYVLMRCRQEQEVSLVEVSPENNNQWTEKLKGLPNSDWHPAATSHEVLWLSYQGHVVANPARERFEFITWNPSAIKPEFRLGPPHCARDGRLWLQVMHPEGYEGEPSQGFISLGRAKQDWNPSGGPRTLSGKSSIKVEKRLGDEPWIEPDIVSSEAHDNNEAVVPLLESVSDGSMLVLRVDHTTGIKQFFERDERLSVRFQIMGQHSDEQGFFATRMHQPWKTLAFIYEDYLYLYHPEMANLPGWRVDTASVETSRAAR
ncbi:hypothetical protein [Massilia niabensis]|uniref:Uncharacterized protein n=1 Tax=Massilia niabensis TaxID=544910 RepID=A0ABW0L6H9_9BURK